MALKEMLQLIKEKLTEKQKIREITQEKTRKITSLSKQAILFRHQNKLNEAKKNINLAEKLITEVEEIAKDESSILYSGMFSDALQEFAEANIFLALLDRDCFTSPKEIRVPDVEFILGLADVIGEFRRVALDSIRVGEVKKAIKCLEIMDEIYVEITALDEAYMLVPGLRRKCDVARKIIEVTRGDITQEVRRKSLEEYLEKFENNFKKMIKK